MAFRSDLSSCIDQRSRPRRISLDDSNGAGIGISIGMGIAEGEAEANAITNSNAASARTRIQTGTTAAGNNGGSINSTNSTDSTKFQALVKKPTKLDVLLGRGGGTNHWVGNCAFREYVHRHKAIYDATPLGRKYLIAFAIVDEWNNQGGRFLERVNPKAGPGSVVRHGGKWKTVATERAFKKTFQCLRSKAVFVPATAAKNNKKYRKQQQCPKVVTETDKRFFTPIQTPSESVNLYPPPIIVRAQVQAQTDLLTQQDYDAATVLESCYSHNRLDVQEAATILSALAPAATATSCARVVSPTFASTSVTSVGVHTNTWCADDGIISVHPSRRPFLFQRQQHRNGGLPLIPLLDDDDDDADDENTTSVVYQTLPFKKRHGSWYL